MPSAWLVADAATQKRIWSIRENGASATQLSIDPDVPDPQVGWEDAAVDPNRLGDYLREFQALVDRYGFQTSLFGHFGDGCVHARITFNLRTVEGVATFREFIREAAQLVVECGGSLTGEHGDGQAKAEFLPIMFGDELMDALREFKRIWDPENRLNPGKVVDAYRVDENLRMGPQYKVVKLATRMQFRSAEGDGFQRAVEHCVGMGSCRSQQGRHDVPELPGDQGGALLDTRAFAPAVGDAAGRRDQGRLEQRAGQGSARHLPVLQGLPKRLPDPHRHGFVQGGVPVSLLRAEHAPAPGA